MFLRVRKVFLKGQIATRISEQNPGRLQRKPNQVSALAGAGCWRLDDGHQRTIVVNFQATWRSLQKGSVR